MRFMAQLGGLFTSVCGWIILIAAQVMVIDGVRSGTIVLGVVFLIDYITGMGASWKEWKQEKAAGEKGMPPYFLQSNKLRKSLLKATTYLLFVGMSWVAWYLFFDGKIHLPLSSKEVNVISITFGLCIAVECWSILENMKRIGFDLIGQISKTVKGFWRGYKEIKGDS